jgi:hypothetical protein
MPEPFSATAPVKSLPGTAAKPGVTFTGDEDTGLYRSGTNELAVTVGGAEAAKFTATQTSLKGDINLDDGGSFQTTLQLVTPTAARTITFPDATGTVALVAGSSTEAAYASLDGGFAGAVPFAWDGSFSVDGSFGYNPTGGVLSVRDLRSITITSPTIAGNTTFTGRFINSVANAASAPAGLFSGQWFTTGTSTTTKPAVNIEQSGATSTGWSTAGTGLGVNSASTFAGRLLDLQKNATSKFSVSHEGNIAATGDLNLDDGGSFQTTLQLVTPTAARTITFPDATGTVALVGGSTGQLLYNNAGANAGLSTLTTDGTDVTLTGRFISSLNGAASAPPGTFTGTWFTGGTATTTKPQVLIEPTGTTSTAWSTSGTGLGVNAVSGFVGRLLDLQINGTSEWSLSNTTFTIGEANDIAVGTSTGTKIGTATTQKLGFYNATPVVQPAAVTDITTTATAGTLPTPDGTVTIADADAPTVDELLEYCVELEAKLEAALGHLRTLGLIAT